MVEILKKSGMKIVPNIPTILLSFVMALVLWLVISLQIFPDITLHIPDVPVASRSTAFMNDERLEIVQYEPHNIAIEIKGKRYQIGSLKTENFTAELDLSPVDRPGEYDVDVHIQSDSDIMTQYDLMGSYKAHIRVVEMATATLKLNPDVSEVHVAENMKIDMTNIIMKPDKLIIHGEKDVVDSLKFGTVKVTYDGVLSSSLELTGDVQFHNMNDVVVQNPNVTYDISSFNLSLPVIKLKSLGVGVTFLNAPPNFNLDAFKSKANLLPDTITVSAPANDTSIDNLSAINIGEIPLSELTLADVQRAVSLPVTLPSGYGNVSGNTVVAMTFNDMENYGSMSFEVLKGNFTATNIPDGYKVKFLTNKIDVNVVGPSAFIKSMSPADVLATVNLAGITDIDGGEKSITASCRILGTNVDAWVSGEHKLSFQLVKETTE